MGYETYERNMKFLTIILFLTSTFAIAEPVKYSVGIKLTKYAKPPVIAEIVNKGHCENRDFENQPFTCTHIPE